MKVALTDRWDNVQVEMARVCAQLYGGEAKEVTPVLVKALKERGTYNLTNPSTTADTSGTEANRGKTNINPNLGEDGRFMIALALGRSAALPAPMPKKSLEDASKDKNSEKLPRRRKMRWRIITPDTPTSGASGWGRVQRTIRAMTPLSSTHSVNKSSQHGETVTLVPNHTVSALGGCHHPA